MDDLKQGGIAVIDFGSQYTQLIARRIRELGVYSEVFSHDGSEAQINLHQPAGYILSGGPASVYELRCASAAGICHRKRKTCTGHLLWHAALDGGLWRPGRSVQFERIRTGDNHSQRSQPTI